MHFAPDEKDGIVEYYMDGEVRHEQISKLNDRVVAYTDAAQVVEEDAPPAEDIQAEEEAPLQEEASVPKEDDTTPLDEEELAPKAEEDAEEKNEMPMRDNGEEDWQATTPEHAHSYIFNEAGLSQREGNEFVAAQKDAAQRALNKAKSAQAPRVGTSIRQYNEAKAKHQEKIDNAQRVLDYWNAVQDIQVAIQHKEREQKEAEDAKAHEEAAAQMQAEFEARKAADAERAEVGNENPMPTITEKWSNAEKIDGHSDEIVLPDGTALKGHYVLHESGASSPSHNAETWKMTEGFPMDVNDNSVNDRDYEHDKDAQAHTEEIARHYDQRALQSVPVVSQDGVVLSGNGRTMAGELAARDNTDKAYIDYLKAYAHKFGFTPEQVEAMEHPRVSFVPNEAMPYTAETFARFNQQEMKSQSKTEQAVKLGKTVSDDAFRAIVRTINGFDTLGDFYNDPKESVGAVYDLHSAGVIPQTQLAEMVDGIRGQERLSAVGREYLENMLIGKAFANEPDVLRMLTAEPAMRQTIITALGEIVDNIALGEDWALQGELADAVKLCFEARKDGAKYGDIVSAFARQGILFADPDQIQTKADFRNVTMLMLADALNDKRVTLLKTVLQLYNNEARLSASGQSDMFAGGIQSREDILRNVINYIKENYGKSKEIEAARAEAMERRKAESLQEDGDSGTSIVGIQDEDEAKQKLALKEDENPQRNVASSKEESPTDFTPSPRKEGEDLLDYAARVDEESKADHKRKQEEAKVNTIPSDAQKEAGNYKKGHIKVDGMDITIEQPKGSTRTGKDASGKEWRSEIHNTYGYIRGTESVDGDHIDIFLSDNPADGNVFVVDQVNKDGSFDEHKVMYGFADVESAKQAYLSNYEKGWQGLGNITEVSKDEFKKWIDSSKRKTKPFAEYSSVKKQGNEQTKKPTEAEDFTRQDLKELEDFQKNTDTTGRTAIDIDRYDAEDLFAPLKLDGKPSNLGVLTVVSDKITDPASQIAVYDYSDEIDDKTNSGWQKWGDLADEYNKTVDKDDKAQERGDTATLGFRTVDAAVKFSDWLNTDGQTKHQRDASLQYSGETLANDTRAKQKATEAVLAALSKAGIEVVRATDEEVKVLLSNSLATTLRTPQGTIYGWSVNGKIYLTEAGINPDTPIHEYTHLWAEAMMIKNKKGWDSIKALLKDNPIWNEVVADANYSNIADNEDAVASEVLSRISGKKNAAKMEEEAQRAIDEAKGVFEKARATTILTNLKKALNSLWKWVSKNIFDVKEFSSISEVTDKVLYDLIHGTKLINDKSLIGVHNISEQKLRKVLKQGGFANPSIAVIDADKQVHDDYGEISLILPSRKVNKSTGKNAGTYEGDAWTPMYPIVEKQMSSDGSLIMHNDINSVPNEMQSEVRNALNRWLDNGSDTDLSYLYLFQQGKAPKMATVMPKYSNEVYKSLRDIMFGVDSVYNLTKGEVKNLVELYVQTELNGDIDEYNKANERRIAKYKDAIESGRTNSMYYKIAERNLEEVKKYGYPLSSLKTFADDVQRDKTKQGSKNVQKTLSAASQIIKDAGLEEDFRNWVEGLNNRYQTKEVIFDGFTPTGKRRYIPNTLENVSKLMKKQGRQASTGLGVSFSNFAASVMKANGSLANIRKKKSKLTNEHKDIEDFEEKWKEVYFDLAMKLQPNASTFDDYGFTRLREAALEADPQAFLSKEYGVTLSKEDVRKLKQMVKAIQEERPAMYFETKFERPVTLNEFSKAVVPEDLSDDLQKTLRDNGIEIFTYKRGDAEDRQKATQEAAYSSDDIAFQIISNGNNEANNDSDTRFQIVGNSLSDEEKKIVETAKANNTYMKAPNGKPTNLNEKQWAQVRTKAFKAWFGDWEKAARIEKLRKSKPVVISGNEYKGKYELNRDSAKAWIKENLRGEYTITDTEEKVVLTKVGANKVTSHGMNNKAHLQSIAIIPQLIRHAIFVEERPNEKNNNKYDSYRYYVCGLKIGTTDYTVKLTIGVKSGKKYYDHALTEIEKGELLDRINDQADKKGFTTTGGAPLQSYALSIGKDTKLVSILQTNSSKVVDENGEPMVVYHGSNNTFTEFDTTKIGNSTGTSDGRGFYFTTDKGYAYTYGKYGSVISAFLSIDNPLSLREKTITKRQLFDIIKRIDEKEFTADGEHWLISNYGNYQENGIEGTIREAVENEYPYSDNDVELVNSLISASGNSNLVFSSVYEITGKSSEIVPKGNGSVHYVVTIPNQIKSAVNNNGEFSLESDDIRFRQEDRDARELKEVNERFNEELQRYVSGEMDKNEMLHLGNPQGVIKEFLPNLPIVMRQRIIKKGSEKRHNVDVAAIMDMPESLSAPIFVFQRSTDTIGVLTDMKDREGKNVCVAVELNKRIQNGAVYLEVNDVRSFHGREVKNIVEPIVNNHTLMWADKEKGLAYLSSASHQVQQEIDKQVLISAANILKDFENPTIEGKNHTALSENILPTESLRDRKAMRNEAEQLAEKLHTPINVVEDSNEITHPNKEIEARRRKAKGWYNVSTGEVVVVLANHKDAADVAATISHEVIAHKGLRELVGEAHYDEFLDEVYNHLRGDLKREIDDAAGRALLNDINKSGDDVRDYKRHRRIAVDELFGSLAEKPFEEFSESERSLWQQIKEFAKKLLDRFLDKLKLPKWFELGDNELRYILWRSKERLERGKEDPIDQARDIVKREELGLTNEPLNKVSVTARNFEELAEQNEWNPKPIRGEEMVDLYEIAPKVTTHDYYLGTKAGFKLVKSAEDVRDTWEKLKQQDGFRYVHSPKSDSEYLVNDKTGEIYRISDHWGWVASCRWSIDDQAPSIFSIGKANIKDFERIKGNYVFTPEAQRREPGHETYLRAKENLERALKDDTYKFTAAARRLAEEKVRSHQSNAEFYEQNHESGDIVYRRNEFGKYIPYREMKHSREQWFEGYISDEEREIVERAQADGSYMKAPNGKPSNLNGKQWAQVRTKAFKKWFGDWEKAARIEKLRKSEPVEISGNEYKGKYELNRDSAKAWIRDLCTAIGVYFIC